MDAASDEFAAAQFFPPVSGMTVVHVHYHEGRFVVGGRQLTVEEFHREVVERLGLPAGEPLIVVACGLAAGAGQEASELALLAGRPVVAATADAFTLPSGPGVPEGEVVAWHPRYAADGSPVMYQPGQWVVARPDGSQPTELGPYLLTSLRQGNLTTALRRPATVGEHATPPPRRLIRWNQGPPPGQVITARHDPLRRGLAGPGEFDAGSFDKVWGKLPNYPVRLPRGAAGRAGDGVLLEQRWAADAAAWRAVLDELAGHAPAPALGKRAEGFPAGRAEAFDVYARARDEHEAAAGRAALAQAYLDFFAGG